MKPTVISLSCAIAMAAAVGATAIAQSRGDSVETRVAAAKAAAGTANEPLFSVLCAPNMIAPPPSQGRGGGGGQQPPDRAVWHAEPVKVFGEEPPTTSRAPERTSTSTSSRPSASGT